MSKIITQEEIEKQIYNKNPYVKIIGKYQKMKIPIECQCLICGENYSALPENLKQGKKHQKCAHLIGTAKRTKSHVQFIQEMAECNPNISILGQYVNSYTKILCRCNIHNQDFSMSPTHLLQGKIGCVDCISQKMFVSLGFTHEEFIDRIKILQPDITILGIYHGSKYSISVQCNKCNFMWTPIAGSLLSGFGCPHCVGRHKTTEEFIQEIAQYNPNICIKSAYYNSLQKVLCECNICHFQWWAKPSNLKYTGCPMCNLSRGERQIKSWLDRNQILYEPQKTYEGLYGVKDGLLSYDFYLKDYNMLVEYQGEFHDGTAYQQTEEEFQIQQEHDFRKKQYAINHNINLLEIWYWDYDNISNILERNLC